jgi:hypothetical protein
MLRALTVLTVGFITLAALPQRADAANYILYVQGRGWNGWDGEVVSAAGWTNVTLAFDGNSRLDGPATNTTVRNAIQTYCSSPNVCIIHVYSAGALRTLKAVKDLRTLGYSLAGLSYVESAGGASGGTKVAELSTSGGTKILAKLIGQQEKIDFDLTPGAARNTWSSVQGSISPKVMYQVAAKNDVCKGLWVFKLCGNKYVNSGYAAGTSVADGVVAMDSAGGYSTQGAYSTGWLSGSATYGKYAGRRYEDPGYYVGGIDQTPATGTPKDHFGVPGTVTAIIGTDVTGTGYDRKQQWSDSVSAVSNCSGTNCDDGFASTCQNWSKLTSCTAIATGVTASSSNTTAASTYGATCRGKCGLYTVPGATCRCDSGCVSAGTCCSDYSGAANCPNTLAK